MEERKQCLVICSGGLDSTTAAAHARFVDHRDVILVHFLYGCRAERREVESVANIAKALDARYLTCSLPFLKELGHSPLTERGLPIAPSIAGAEFCYEWVPARNLLFLAHAAALCDASNISEISMGLNLEEGAVYPDNTIEFYEKMNDVLQLASTSRPTIKMPLARMMKWQIVEFAYEIGAPIHLSWSCYREGPLHCGNCGPCYMRRTAHKMVGLEDEVKYLVDIKDAKELRRATRKEYRSVETARR